MRYFLFAALLVMSFAPRADAQQAQIESVIGAQIEAFQADDFARAFTFAAPSIRGLFRTPENFGRMVVQGYPMVWRPASVSYGALREADGRLVQIVRISDQAGGAHVLAYEMVETAQGWRIASVHLLRPADVGA